MFAGRKNELKTLNDYYGKKSGQIVAIYGRRRVGKSCLIKEFCQNKNHFYFEGLEGKQRQDQIQHFVNQLISQTHDPFLSQIVIKSWNAVFDYVTNHVLKNQKTILVFDELQWMAANQSKLVALIKYYWDNHWKEKKVFLILCGSISSYMINHVIKSKALYGRVNLELHLTGFYPIEAKQFLHRRNHEDLIKYLMLFGGIPKYLEEINQNQSFDANINRLCFKTNAFMVNEFEKIFYGQFPEAASYLKIIKLLANGPKSLTEISQLTHIASGGGLKSYLNNLIQADFVMVQNDFEKSLRAHHRKYKICDEYLNFYFKYIEPHKHIIQTQTNPSIFQKLVKPKWQPWLGLCFERFCYKHAVYLSKVMGFDDELIESSSLTNTKKGGTQIDLILKRMDNVIVLCEIKFYDSEITTKIIPEFDKKVQFFTPPRGYSIEKALISLYGPTPSLKDTEYFDYYVTVDDLFN